MKANLLFLKSSLSNFNNLEQYYSSLEKLVLARELALQKGDRVYKPGGWDNTILNEIIETLDRSDRKLVPKIIQGLSFLFNSKTIALSAAPDSIEDLNLLLNDRPNGFLGIFFNNAQTYFIKNTNDWYSFHHYKLIETPPTINEFCISLAPYFEKLHFNNLSIPNYLNTLFAGSHLPVMETIMHHLIALENKFYDIFKEYRAEGVPKVCARFQAEMDGNPIPFGCSTDHDGIDSLEIEFVDENTDIIKSIYCDPHTKIWDYLEENFVGHHGDRIYFSQPLDDFLPGKILIGRIGCHN